MIEGDSWTCDTQAKFDSLIAQLKRDWEEHHYIVAKYKIGKQRSPKQQNALEVYCRLLSEEFNNAGLDMKKVLKADVDIPWSQRSVKEFIWRPVQIAVLDKVSTTKPHRDEYPKVYEVLNRHLSDKYGISVPWPTKKEQDI